MLLNNNNSFKYFGYMVDCSRGAVPTVATLKDLVDILSKFGYNYLALYIEDIYTIEDEPYFGYMRGKYSKEEIKELDQYCLSKGMELRPYIQTLAHLNRIKRHACYSYLFEIDDILNTSNDQVYQLIDKMFNAISSTFTSKNIHIGMDEAYCLGRGKILDTLGYKTKKEIMESHLLKVSKLAKKYNFKCQIWADMLLTSYYENNDKDNFVINLPENITAVDWRYYLKSNKDSLIELKLFQKITNNHINFASGAHKWYGYMPNNIHSMKLFEEQIPSCVKVRVNDFLVTGWADGAAEASQFSTLPALFKASVLAHNLNLEDAKPLFKEIIGIDFDSYLKIDCLNRLSMKPSDKEINNLSYIYFYNDLFQGLFNQALLTDTKKLIKKCIPSLRKISKQSFKYNYIFSTAYRMAKFLYYKAELSKELYLDYQNKDMKFLKSDIKNLKLAILNLNIFMKEYENQWLTENKTFGYEKQLIRLGGLLNRMKFCLEQLKKFANKEINKIDELEEKHLDISLATFDPKNKTNFVYNFYDDIVSGGSMKNI